MLPVSFKKRKPYITKNDTWFYIYFIFFYIFMFLYLINPKADIPTINPTTNIIHIKSSGPEYGNVVEFP